MDATIRNIQAPHSVMRCWEMAKTLGDSEKFQLSLMLMESIKPAFVKTNHDDDSWVKKMWEEPVEPFTKEEINAIIDKSEADIAAGKGIPDEEVWRKFDEELAHEEQLELSEAI